MYIFAVAPYTGAWIEIAKVQNGSIGRYVAPYTGAWIEITGFSTGSHLHFVAPYTGAWIEIDLKIIDRFLYAMSLPTRERGLK